MRENICTQCHVNNLARTESFWVFSPGFRKFVNIQTHAKNRHQNIRNKSSPINPGLTSQPRQKDLMTFIIQHREQIHSTVCLSLMTLRKQRKLKRTGLLLVTSGYFRNGGTLFQHFSTVQDDGHPGWRRLKSEVPTPGLHRRTIKSLYHATSRLAISNSRPNTRPPSFPSHAFPPSLPSPLLSGLTLIGTL